MQDSTNSRKLVFLSHANPEDNDFTLWLAGRLASHGYLVWSDLTKLIGAEVYWNDIEDAIRNHSAKVVVGLSRESQEKNGVLDEVNLAVTVERSQHLNEFVVPVRIDDLAFSEVKANLARKNIIDFHTGWAQGLHILLEVLERDHVPRQLADSVAETSTWFARVVDGEQSVERGPQTLLTNWAEIISYPETLHFFRIPIKQDKVFERFKEFACPVYPYADMIATFANTEELQSGMPRHMTAIKAHDVSLQAIFDDELHPLSQRLSWNEAANMLSYLISGAWDRTMMMKGLRSYELSNGRKAWYPENEYADGNWARFVDVSGIERKKRLVGYSKKRKVYWHFAVEAVPSIGRDLMLILKPHVVFSQDGVTPLTSSARMHSLRRGFCRSWWNERWRGLLLAFADHVTDDDIKLEMVVGDGQMFQLNMRLMTFEAPVYLGGVGEEPVEEDQTDYQLDEISGEDQQAYKEEDDTGDADLNEDAEEETNELASNQ